jgi:hypothetical protein
MTRLLPYAAALTIGMQWHDMPLCLSIPALLVCAYLVYTDSKDDK